MKNAVHCLTLALVTFVFVASGGAQEAENETDRAALRKADGDWSAVAEAKDIEGFVAAVAQNGSVLPPNTSIATGRDAIRQWASGLMANPGYALSWQETMVEVSKGGDLGYTVGSYDLTLHDAQGNPVTDHGKYVTVWKKQPDGKWKVVADIFNSDPPTPTSSPDE